MKLTLSTQHSFGFVGICLLLAAGGAGTGGGLTLPPGVVFGRGSLGGPGGHWDGWDPANGSGRGGRVVLSQLPAPVMVPRCELCPAASPVAVLAAWAISQPRGPHPAPAHPPRCSEAIAPCISCDGFQTLLRFCSRRRVEDARPLLRLPGEPRGWTRSRRGGPVPLMHGIPKGWVGEPERDNWGRGPMVCWGDEAGMTLATPGWAGDGAGGDGAVRAGSVRTAVPPIPCPAL